ncbi:FAD-binding oxidoreductase [Rhodobacteraceae bacterium WD3A24]|nr:FAD-binding oxidoreductase [Rhodobacteraceae bacterium WD3A24]
MTVSHDTLDAFRAEIDGVRVYDDPKMVAARSRDYFWYSPILDAELDGLAGDIVVMPEDEDEVKRVAAAAARHGLPVTLRGGGTGNYGQCVPLEGGVILDITRLNKVIEIGEGRVRVQAGMRISRLEEAVAESGQMLNMFPSTKRTATIGGFISGGSGGIGSLRHGMLADGGNVSYIRVVTVEPEPRVIELEGDDTLKVQHAYGTNGIITALDFALSPATDWLHAIALFDGYDVALRFATKAQAEGLDCFLMTPVERRFAPFYKRLEGLFPPDRDAVFTMVAPEAAEEFARRVAEAGGTISLQKPLAEIEAAGLPPAWECGWNHTTLQALKHEPGVWTYLQVAYPRPFDPDLVMAQMRRYGDEVYFHHEMARMDGEIQIFALPLVRWTSRARIYEIIDELESTDGCTVFDPHVVTIEDGGMKEIDTAQIAFKKLADPRGLMNPGKTRGWTADMAAQ